MTHRAPTGLGFGAAPLGNARPPIPRDEALATLNKAFDSGIRYFDTAPLYGRGLSETLLSPFLAEKPRDEIVLSTKVGRLIRDGDFIYDYSYGGVMLSIEESLERLGVATLDIVYVHDIGAITHGADHPQVLEEAIEGGFAALSRLKDEGVVGAVGIGVNEIAVCLEVLPRVALDYVMLAGRYTLLDQSADAKLFPALKQHGAEFIAAAPFNSGILVKGAVPGARFDYQPAPADILDRVRGIAAICDEYDVPLPAAALQFPLRHPDVECVLSGMRTRAQVEQGMAWLETPIPEEFWQALKRSG